ncbi:DNA polymerase III subunit delta' [Roseovarius faecimaris]|uniref:DNA polymerase III subunit delta n=1 Tax=Roseovarius faecimaris TaxID=2494550 RepID=A0A6I6ISN6_9RHOB|nr:DNA polymerase III subunit delta' [Roseovarius faecimaris]QGX98903.1 DNA polymerase III subunit delta' [Roseovarius faecimaris]
MSDTAPEPDRVEGAPHPRETLQLYGQDAAQAAFLDAYNTGRLHHGWLLTGPRGVGKATLAWRIARFLLATPEAQEGGLFGDAPPRPTSLDISPDHPVARRIAAGSDPGLHLLRRGGAGTTERDRQKNFEEGKFSAFIRVDEIRELARFIHLSAVDAGRRVVIVDAADEMNTAAANALLKMLEEPPERTTLLLVSHQPARLLPTIRSRCRALRLAPLSPPDLNAALVQAGVGDALPDALAELAAGSVGNALRLTHQGGLALYQELLAILASLPRLDRPRALKLADAVSARGAGEMPDLLFTLTDLALARLARSGATGTPPAVEAAPGEAATFARLAPDAHTARKWADLAQQITARARQGRAVNLDPAALVLDMVFQMQSTAVR